MVRLIGPMMSGQARGKFGSALIFKMLHGRAIATRYFRPRNPNTPAQKLVRKRVQKAVFRWQDATQETKTLWRTYAKQFRTTGYNAYVSAFVIYMRDHAEAEPAEPFEP